VITIPYVMRTMVAAISLLDFGLVDAARTLGCSYAAAVRRVLVPLLAPALVASGLFSFLASLDNYAVSIFFTDAWTKTLPIQILQYVEEQPDPTIAAISTVLIAFTLLALFVCERVVGLGRMIDF
jgi:putative spermidine/putrescine transport system permease protein